MTTRSASFDPRRPRSSPRDTAVPDGERVDKKRSRRRRRRATTCFSPLTRLGEDRRVRVFDPSTRHRPARSQRVHRSARLSGGRTRRGDGQLCGGVTFAPTKPRAAKAYARPPRAARGGLDQAPGDAQSSPRRRKRSVCMRGESECSSGPSDEPHEARRSGDRRHTGADHDHRSGHRTSPSCPTPVESQYRRSTGALLPGRRGTPAPTPLRRGVLVPAYLTTRRRAARRGRSRLWRRHRDARAPRARVGRPRRGQDTRSGQATLRRGLPRRRGPAHDACRELRRGRVAGGRLRVRRPQPSLLQPRRLRRAWRRITTAVRPTGVVAGHLFLNRLTAGRRAGHDLPYARRGGVALTRARGRVLARAGRRRRGGQRPEALARVSCDRPQAVPARV